MKKATPRQENSPSKKQPNNNSPAIQQTRLSPAPKVRAITKTSTRVSLRGAIDSNCKDCIYDPTQGGSWRKQVEDCTVKACSLYPVRPLPIKSVRKG